VVVRKDGAQASTLVVRVGLKSPIPHPATIAIDDFDVVIT